MAECNASCWFLAACMCKAFSFTFLYFNHLRRRRRNLRSIPCSNLRSNLQCHTFFSKHFSASELNCEFLPITWAPQCKISPNWARIGENYTLSCGTLKVMWSKSILKLVAKLRQSKSKNLLDNFSQHTDLSIEKFENCLLRAFSNHSRLGK